MEMQASNEETILEKNNGEQGLVDNPEPVSGQPEEATVADSNGPESISEGGIGEQQIVIFKLGNEEFGVNISEVKEIIKVQDITKVPDSETYIEGIINLRGKIVVIIDLEKRLSLDISERNKDTRIIVLEIGKNTVGMIVDSCNEVMRLNSSQIQSAPEIITQKINSDYVQGVGMIEERLIILLDLLKVLGSEEISKIAEKHAA